MINCSADYPKDNKPSKFLQLTLNIKRFDSQTNTGSRGSFSAAPQIPIHPKGKIDICITYKQMSLHQLQLLSCFEKLFIVYKIFD
jgi:hypothetical protein